MPELLVSLMLWVQIYLGSPILPPTPAVNLLNPIQWEQALESEGGGSHIIAFYNTETLAIYLPEGWNPDDVYDRGSLVHEIVHAFQHQVPQRLYECHALREHEAYRAQAAYLMSNDANPFSDDRRAVSRWVLLITSRCTEEY